MSAGQVQADDPHGLVAGVKVPLVGNVVRVPSAGDVFLVLGSSPVTLVVINSFGHRRTPFLLRAVGEGLRAAIANHLVALVPLLNRVDAS
jgi:hypothetical protein